MKMRFAIATFLIIVLMLSGCTSQSSDQYRQCPNGTRVNIGQDCPTEGSNNTTSNQPAPQTTQPQPPQQQVQSPAAPSQTSKEKVIGLGETIQVDDLTYKVVKAESFTKMGSSVFNKETTGKFVKVYIEITNQSNKSQYILTPRFEMIDSQGRQFDSYPNTMLYIADAIDFIPQLQPGLTLSGAEVFEMPKDATGLMLEISGDWLSLSKVTVKIDDINDIGQDTTLQVQNDKTTQDILSQCNTPFKCSDSCAQYTDVGQKDCPSGQLCCYST